MKFTWGTGIALFYGAFALAMISAVIASRQYDPGLVDKNYYDLDIHYQAHLEKKQNTATLTEMPSAAANAEQQTVALQFPAGMKVTEGTAKFFRSAEVGDDFKVQLSSDADGKIIVPTTKLHTGRWHVELDWVAGGKQYFYATTFNV